MDVVKGLGTSVRGEWSGDVDLNDGKLSSLYQNFKDRMKAASKIGLGENGTQQAIESDLTSSLRQLDDDLIFLNSGK